MKKMKIVVALVLGLLLCAVLAAADNFTGAQQIISSRTPCANLTQDQLSQVGDYIMEQQHPGYMHERMDAMLGGEGSASLEEYHVSLAQQFYCGNAESGYAGAGSGYAGYGPYGMMGYGSTGGYGMMGGYYGGSGYAGAAPYAMMGYAGYGPYGMMGSGYYWLGWLGSLIWLIAGALLLALAVLGIVLLARKLRAERRK